eukprot:COSAG02_NODE_3312_length_6955_cov_2.028151_1_plen_91_part_10
MEATWIHHYTSMSYPGGQVRTLDVFGRVPTVQAQRLALRLTRSATACSVLAAASDRNELLSFMTDNHLWRTLAVAIFLKSSSPTRQINNLY